MELATLEHLKYPRSHNVSQVSDRCPLGYLFSLGYLFRRSRVANSKVSGGIPPKFDLIQAFMCVLVTCKNEEDLIKDEGSKVLRRFSPLCLCDIFSIAQGQLTPRYAIESCRISNSSEIL